MEVEVKVQGSTTTRNLKTVRNSYRMDGLKSLRNYAKRVRDDSPDSDRAGDEEDWESGDERKHW
ncbi:hypothetical protein C5167_004604 [Papaver somniferum]|uniref:Uncharacterized protein n=1 Tax=Papaver somniferum TaxID=3469 RepID=A0A4Y7J8Y8_PAPSO|nr:hypothetical protein C5167_004604 [Papaver somniferum]